MTLGIFSEVNDDLFGGGGATHGGFAHFSVKLVRRGEKREDTDTDTHLL